KHPTRCKKQTGFSVFFEYLTRGVFYTVRRRPSAQLVEEALDSPARAEAVAAGQQLLVHVAQRIGRDTLQRLAAPGAHGGAGDSAVAASGSHAISERVELFGDELASLGQLAAGAPRQLDPGRGKTANQHRLQADRPATGGLFRRLQHRLDGAAVETLQTAQQRPQRHVAAQNSQRAEQIEEREDSFELDFGAFPLALLVDHSTSAQTV